jgi:hypothetical protein
MGEGMRSSTKPPKQGLRELVRVRHLDSKKRGPHRFGLGSLGRVVKAVDLSSTPEGDRGFKPHSDQLRINLCPPLEKDSLAEVSLTLTPFRMPFAHARGSGFYVAPAWSRMAPRHHPKPTHNSKQQVWSSKPPHGQIELAARTSTRLEPSISGLE